MQQPRHDAEVYETRDLRVRWVELGEGASGEYDPGDPGDVELLRLDVELSEDTAEEYGIFGEEADEAGWLVPQDASFCTAVPAATPQNERARLLGEFVETLTAALVADEFSGACEELSYAEVGYRHVTSGEVKRAGMAAELQEQGLDVSEIAAAMRCDVATVRGYLKMIRS